MMNQLGDKRRARTPAHTASTMLARIKAILLPQAIKIAAAYQKLYHQMKIFQVRVLILLLIRSNNYIPVIQISILRPLMGYE